MNPFKTVAVFVSGLIVGHVFGTVYGAALMTNKESNGGCTKPHFTNYEG